MAWFKLFVLTGFAGAGALALMAAQQPSALPQVQAGLWEISGAPGGKAPLKQCVSNVASLAEFEHRGRSCSLKIIRTASAAAVYEYSCGSAGFGRSEIDVLTPRSLRIETQGISENLPFSYVLQARRVGDCPGQSTASRH